MQQVAAQTSCPNCLSMAVCWQRLANASRTMLVYQCNHLVGVDLCSCDLSVCADHHTALKWAIPQEGAVHRAGGWGSLCHPLCSMGCCYFPPSSDQAHHLWRACCKHLTIFSCSLPSLCHPLSLLSLLCITPSYIVSPHIVVNLLVQAKLTGQTCY